MSSSNFDFLPDTQEFALLKKTAKDAERFVGLSDDARYGILISRSALEIAVRWIYSVDDELRYLFETGKVETTLHKLTDHRQFKKLLRRSVLSAVNKVRMMGNDAAHLPKGRESFSYEEGVDVLYSLFEFLDWLVQTYVEMCFVSREFSKSLVPSPADGTDGTQSAQSDAQAALWSVKAANVPVPSIAKLVEENRESAEAFNAAKKAGWENYQPATCDTETQRFLLEKKVGELNKRQAQAVKQPVRNALVWAGAGTGKTRVLTTRIAWLIATGLARPDQILALTFTNKAAGEIHDRLIDEFGLNVERMMLGTFHSVALKLLRQHPAEAGLPVHFTVMDDDLQRIYIDQLLSMPDAVQLREKLELPVNGHGDSLFDPFRLQSAINLQKERGFRAADMKTGETSEEQFLKGFYEIYERECRSSSRLDFGELIFRATEMLERNPELREEYSARLGFVLIDEFQDISGLQYRLIKQIAGPDSRRNTVFCVGDDDQRIYGFRGVRSETMKRFIEEFHISSMVTLDTNYRSTQVILDAANRLIAFNEDRFAKSLSPTEKTPQGDQITVTCAFTPSAEAAWVVKGIEEMHRQGARWRDCAVLYRNKANVEDVKHSLEAHDIPFTVVTSRGFYDRPEIRTVMSWLGVLGSQDDDSLWRLFSLPGLDLSGGLKAELFELKKASGGEKSFWEILDAYESGGAHAAEARRVLDRVVMVRCACLDLPLPEMICRIVDLVGDQDIFTDERNIRSQTDNLQQLADIASNFYEEFGIDPDRPAIRPFDEEGNSPISEFIGTAALAPEEKPDTEANDRVQLMTVHTSKGLEFQNVWLVAAEQGKFPYGTWKKDLSREEFRKLISDERRLMYVAMTRARRRLFISWVRRRKGNGVWSSKTFDQQRSQFIDELPEDYLDFQFASGC